MGLILSRQELAEALGVSDSTVGSWEAKGCPVRRKGRGRGRKSFYDFEAVRAWCEKNDCAIGLNALVRQASTTAVNPAAISLAPPDGYSGKIAEAIAAAVGQYVHEYAHEWGSDDPEIPPAEMWNMLSCFCVFLASELSDLGFPGVEHILESYPSRLISLDEHFKSPQTLEELLALCPRRPR